MLDPWIIEEIRRREEEERQHREQPVIHIEPPRYPETQERGRRDSNQQPGEQRGVIVIDFSV